MCRNILSYFNPIFLSAVYGNQIKTVALSSVLANPTFHGTTPLVDRQSFFGQFAISRHQRQVSMFRYCLFAPVKSGTVSIQQACQFVLYIYLHLYYSTVPVFKINWLLLVTCYMFLTYFLIQVSSNCVTTIIYNMTVVCLSALCRNLLITRCFEYSLAH